MKDADASQSGVNSEPDASSQPLQDTDSAPIPEKKRRGRPPKNKSGTSTPAQSAKPTPSKPKRATPKTKKVIDTTAQEDPETAEKKDKTKRPLSRRSSGRLSRGKSTSSKAKYNADGSDEEYVGGDDSDDDDDYEEQDEEPEGDDNAEDAYEDDEEEKPSRPPSRRNGKQAATPKKPGKAPARSGRTPSSRITMSGSKENVLSRKRKMQGSIQIQAHIMAGHNQEELMRAVKMREYWEGSVFIPKRSQIGRGMVYASYERNAPIEIKSRDEDDDEDMEGEYDVPYIQNLKVITADQAKEYLVKPASLKVNGEEVSSFDSLITEESGKRNGAILNAGGVVTSIAWAEGHADPSVQYLAVGLLDGDTDPVNSPIVTPETSIFSTAQRPASIYFYQTNLGSKETEGGSITKLVFTLSSEHGSPLEIAWRPVVSPRDLQPNSMGLLAVLSQDGVLRVYNIPLPGGSEGPVHLLASKPIREYSLPYPSKMVTFCWRTAEALAVGTTDGQIGEFDLSDTSVFAAEPSYLERPVDSAITTISSGYPNNPTLLFFYSTDGHTCIFDARNPQHRIYNHRHKGIGMASAYCPHAECFIVGDDSHYSYASFIRFFKSHMYTNTLSKHDSVVCDVGLSKYHPYVLSAGSDGVVCVGNVIRRLMARKRLKVSVYEQGCLWALDYSSKLDEYKVCDMYKPVVLEKHKLLDLERVYPHNVTVNNVAWSTCFDSAEWYAASTTGGLIRLHRLYDGAPEREPEPQTNPE